MTNHTTREQTYMPGRVSPRVVKCMPVASVSGLMGAKHILGGQEFCFYCMLKTNFSGHNKLFGGAKQFEGYCTRMPPRGCGTGEETCVVTSYGFRIFKKVVSPEQAEPLGSAFVADKTVVQALHQPDEVVSFLHLLPLFFVSFFGGFIFGIAVRIDVFVLDATTDWNKTTRRNSPPTSAGYEWRNPPISFYFLFVRLDKMFADSEAFSWRRKCL